MKSAAAKAAVCAINALAQDGGPCPRGPDFIDAYAEGTICAITASAQQAYEAVMTIEYFLKTQDTRRESARTSLQIGDWP